MSTRSQTLVLRGGRRWRQKDITTCCVLRRILLQSQWSHSASCSPKSGRSGGQNAQCLLRRSKASIRWMSAAVTNPLHAVDELGSAWRVETTSALETSCSPTSDIPWCLSTRRAYNVSALSLTDVD